MYVRGLVVPGMTVKCTSAFEEIKRGDIGTVLKVDTEGLHDLNVQVDWQNHGASYWMCFVHIELIAPPQLQLTVKDELQDSPQQIIVGSHVRIREDVSMPRYKWGSVQRGSIGVVTQIKGVDVIVDFPQQFNWTGQLCEMELVCQGNPAAISNALVEQTAFGDLIEDWSRCIRSLTVSSNETAAKYLLDKSPNYWTSASTSHAKHWIRIEMHENVLVNMLAIHVNNNDASHQPSLVVVRVGDSIDSLKDHSWVALKSTDTHVPLLSDVTKYYAWVEIVIKQCRNNGIQCKVSNLTN